VSDPVIFFLATLVYATVLVLYIDDYYHINDEPLFRFFLIFSPIIALFRDWVLENLIATILIGTVFALYYQLNRIMLIADSIRAVLEEDRRRRYKISDDDMTIYTGAMTDHEVMDIKNRKKVRERKEARKDKLSGMKDYEIFYYKAARGFWILLVSVPFFIVFYSALSEATFWEACQLVIGTVTSLFE
jgi:hypothetical protein